jgi:hypothetical protein
MMQRRSFLSGMAGILASGFAPAAIGSGVLMPVRQLSRLVWVGVDFGTDDWRRTTVFTSRDTKVWTAPENTPAEILADINKLLEEVWRGVVLPQPWYAVMPTKLVIPKVRRLRKPTNRCR